jgi:hypothetical protein
MEMRLLATASTTLMTVGILTMVEVQVSNNAFDLGPVRALAIPMIDSHRRPILVAEGRKADHSSMTGATAVNTTIVVAHSVDRHRRTCIWATETATATSTVDTVVTSKVDMVATIIAMLSRHSSMTERGRRETMTAVAIKVTTTAASTTTTNGDSIRLWVLYSLFMKQGAKREGNTRQPISTSPMDQLSAWRN